MNVQERIARQMRLTNARRSTYKGTVAAPSDADTIGGAMTVAERISKQMSKVNKIRKISNSLPQVAPNASGENDNEYSDRLKRTAERIAKQRRAINAKLSCGKAEIVEPNLKMDVLMAEYKEFAARIHEMAMSMASTANVTATVEPATNEADERPVEQAEAIVPSETESEVQTSTVDGQLPSETDTVDGEAVVEATEDDTVTEAVEGEATVTSSRSTGRRRKSV